MVDMVEVVQVLKVADPEVRCLTIYPFSDLVKAA